MFQVSRFHSEQFKRLCSILTCLASSSEARVYKLSSNWLPIKISPLSRSLSDCPFSFFCLFQCFIFEWVSPLPTCLARFRVDILFTYKCTKISSRRQIFEMRRLLSDSDGKLINWKSSSIIEMRLN